MGWGREEQRGDRSQLDSFSFCISALPRGRPSQGQTLMCRIWARGQVRFMTKATAAPGRQGYGGMACSPQAPPATGAPCHPCAPLPPAQDQRDLALLGTHDTLPPPPDPAGLPQEATASGQQIKLYFPLFYFEVQCVPGIQLRLMPPRPHSSRCPRQELLGCYK